MSIISIRVNDEEMALLDQLSKIYGLGVSSVIKKIVFEKMEDDFDMKIIQKCEDQTKTSQLTLKPLESLSEEVGFDWNDL